MKLGITLLVLASTIVACSSESDGESSSTESSEALVFGKKYDGTWAYRDGSAIDVTCFGQVILHQDLFHAGVDGEPGTFTLTTLKDGRIYELDGLGCQYHFDSTGKTVGGESCNRFPDGKGGFTTVSVETSHKVTNDGFTMRVDASGAVGSDGACTYVVKGNAIRVYR